MYECLHSLHKGRLDEVAVDICECQADKLNRYFTQKQLKQQTNNGSVNIDALIKQDSIIQKRIDSCFTSTGKSVLLNAESFTDDFHKSCMENIRKSTSKKLDSLKLSRFCSCQLDLIRTKKMTDEDYRQLANPNSLFFYEVIYKCGNPYAEDDKDNFDWNENNIKTIEGPGSDTIKILSLNGMTYVKIKTGSMVQFWLFDTGANDMLINAETEAVLKKESLLGNSNYLGTGEYEMANGSIDTCRRYRINEVRIGKYTVNNVIVAVSDKAKKIIVGKTLMNKFSSWILDNKNRVIILNK